MPPSSSSSPPPRPPHHPPVQFEPRRFPQTSTVGQGLPGMPPPPVPRRPVTTVPSEQGWDRGFHNNSILNILSIFIILIIIIIPNTPNSINSISNSNNNNGGNGLRRSIIMHQRTVYRGNDHNLHRLRPHSNHLRSNAVLQRSRRQEPSTLLISYLNRNLKFQRHHR
ncbi:hypothetical protein PG993_005517 [Apiospora rasikravindrae]|uniref:Transmembrane protein n=1 Tax=Apiospora rasikravindrae TaxID=990691 RepID=A0ABR1TFS9_9PEZI